MPARSPGGTVGDMHTDSETSPTLQQVHEMTGAEREQITRAFDAAITDEFRAHGGRVGGSYPFSGTPMLLLHHRGARTGVERVTPLVCAVRPDGWIVTGPRAGSPTEPLWCRDLRAHPHTTIEVATATGTGSVPVKARELHGVERAVGREQLVAIVPDYAGYLTLTDRAFPLFHLAAAP